MNARVKKVVDSSGAHYGVSFKCPGCDDQHVIPTTGSKAWGFNGSFDRPTLTPSILVRYWDDEQKLHAVCHSFVRSGSIEFLADCTHALAGQTVDLMEIES